MKLVAYILPLLLSQAVMSAPPPGQPIIMRGLLHLDPADGFTSQDCPWVGVWRDDLAAWCADRVQQSDSYTFYLRWDAPTQTYLGGSYYTLPGYPVVGGDNQVAGDASWGSTFVVNGSNTTVSVQSVDYGAEFDTPHITFMIACGFSGAMAVHLGWGVVGWVIRGITGPASRLLSGG